MRTNKGAIVRNPAQERLDKTVVCLKRILLYTKDDITKTLIEEVLSEVEHGASPTLENETAREPNI